MSEDDQGDQGDSGSYRLTQSSRDAAALVGWAPNSVARHVLARDAPELKTAPARRTERIDPFQEISGETGIGKTTLVGGAAEERTQGVGACSSSVGRAGAKAEPGVLAVDSNCRSALVVIIGTYRDTELQGELQSVRSVLLDVESKSVSVTIWSGPRFQLLRSSGASRASRPDGQSY